MLRHSLVLLAMLSLFGCGSTAAMPDSSPDAAADGSPDGAVDAAVPGPSVVLGTGTSAFEDIPMTGGELELVGGPQGGFHVFVTARIFEMDPDGMTLTFDATNVATGENVGTPASFNLVLARIQREGDHFVRAGDFLILDNMSPDAVRGLTLDVRVTAQEADGGLMATDHREILVVDNEGG